MITYDKALKTARSLKDGITKCLEYGDAWLFKAENDDTVIILKESGESVEQAYYYGDLGGGRDVDLRAEFAVAN